MLGLLPELDIIICQMLSQHDLSQCAQVSKKWHAIVIPYLWRDLSCLDKPYYKRRQAFRRLLLEDYLVEKQRQELHIEGHSIDQPIQLPSTFPLTTLTKYRSWIRMLPGRESLSLQLPKDSPRSPEHESSEEVKEPKEDELLLHLFKQCYAAQVSEFVVSCIRINKSDVSNAIAELILPRVRHPIVHARYSRRNWRFSKLKSLLGRCSSTLETLTIEFSYGKEHPLGDEDGEEGDSGEGQGGTEAMEWKSFKILRIRLKEGCVGDPQPHKFWLWLFKRCGQVEKIVFIACRSGHIPSFTKNMLAYMPNLTEIIVGTYSLLGQAPVKSSDIATLLSGSSKGWKVVRLRGASKWGSDSMKALENHFSTLEALHIEARYETVTTDLAPLLASSPNLHTLACNYYNRFKISSFIDQDPNTKILRTWACENSLKVLKVQIDNNSRSGLDTHAGQRQELQDRVYDRLARLTSLEILCLRCYICIRQRYGTPEHVCLEMSLESGLYKLSGLRSLKELEVEHLATKIGLKEVQWMVEHWPQLRQLYGLDKKGYGKEAVEWLQANYPKIKLNR